MRIARVHTQKVDRSEARRSHCEQIVRRLFPTADEVEIQFYGPYGEPLATVWHRDGSGRRAKVIRVKEE